MFLNLNKGAPLRPTRNGHAKEETKRYPGRVHPPSTVESCRSPSECCIAPRTRCLNLPLLLGMPNLSHTYYRWVRRALENLARIFRACPAGTAGMAPLRMTDFTASPTFVMSSMTIVRSAHFDDPEVWRMCGNEESPGRKMLQSPHLSILSETPSEFLRTAIGTGPGVDAEGADRETLPPFVPRLIC